MSGEFNSLPDELTTLWLAKSKFVQINSVPTWIVSVAGEKAKPEIVTWVPRELPLLDGAEVGLVPLAGAPAAQEDRTIAKMEKMLISRSFVFILYLTIII
jgi:hypothetical protein